MKSLQDLLPVAEAQVEERNLPLLPEMSSGAALIALNRPSKLNTSLSQSVMQVSSSFSDDTRMIRASLLSGRGVSMYNSVFACTSTVIDEVFANMSAILSTSSFRTLASDRKSFLRLS